MAFSISYNPDRSGLSWAMHAPAPPAMAPVAPATALRAHQTAHAAEVASRRFAPGETVAAGRLSLSVEGQSFAVNFAEGASVSKVADALRGAGADLDVSVRAEQGSHFLHIVRRQSGHETSQPSSSALAWMEDYSSGGEGKALGLQSVQSAQNARLSVGRQTLERRSNVVSDAVKGTTLRLDEWSAATGFVANRNGAGSVKSSEGGRSAFTISVEQIAAAAEARSAPFTSAYEQVQSGHILISVDGGSYLIPLSEGLNLAQVAETVRDAQAPVDVTLATEGRGTALVLSAQTPGHAHGAAPETALHVSFQGRGETGRPLDLQVTRPAKNAKFTLNDQPMESRSNAIAGAAGRPALLLRAPTADTLRIQAAATEAPRDRRAHVRGAGEIHRLLQDQALDLKTSQQPAAAVAAYAHKAYRTEGRDSASLSRRPSLQATGISQRPWELASRGDAAAAASPKAALGATSEVLAKVSKGFADESAPQASGPAAGA